MIYDFPKLFFQKMKKINFGDNYWKENIQIEIYNIFLAMYIQLGHLSYVPSVYPMTLAHQCPLQTSL
jgi:hypothetical protein